MPAVLVVGGLVAGYGATGWALFAAGTMVVSGVMARKAQIDGDKEAESNWMTVGTVASIGYGVASSSGTAAAGDVAGDAATETAIQNSATSAGIDQSMGAAKAGETVSTSSTSGGFGATQGSNSSSNSMAEYMDRADARMLAINNNNLKVQTAGMAMNAYAGYETGQEQKAIEEKKIAAAKALEDEKRANMNNLTELTYNKVNFLPNINAGAAKIRKGLINAPTTTQQLAQG